MRRPPPSPRRGPLWLLAGLLLFLLLPLHSGAAGPALQQADALLQRAGRTLQGPPEAAAWDDLRTARRLFAHGAQLTARERGLGASRAAQVASWLYHQRGEAAAAQAQGRQALRAALRWQRADGPEVLGARQALFSQAVARGRWREAQTALAALQPWLPADGACDDALCATVLSHRSQLHFALGDTARAYAERQAAHRHSRRTGDGNALAWDGSSLAALARLLGRPEDERRWLQALRQDVAAGRISAEHPAAALVRTRLAELDADASAGTAALAQARAQAAREVDAMEATSGFIERDRAGLLLMQAQLSRRAGDTAAAQRQAAEALAIAWALDNGDLAWQAAERLADAAEGADDAPGEAAYGKAFVNALQQHRARLGDASAAAQQRFVARLMHGYENLADALVRQQRLAEAEQVLALVRDGAYHALVRSAPPPQLLPFAPAEQAAQQRLAQRRADLMQAMARWNQASRPRGEGEAAVRAALEPVVAAVLALPGAAEPGPPPAAPAPAPALALGGPPRVLYLPGTRTLRIAVQHDGQTTVREVPLPEEQLLQQIAALRRALQDPASDPRPLAHALYRQLWAPVADLLPPSSAPPSAGPAAPPPPLVRVHPVGALRYLPFGVLFDGTHWLVERTTLALDGGMPAPTRPAPPPARRDGWALLGASHGAGLPALPHVGAELRAIQREALATAAGPADVALDDAFTPQRLQHALARQRVVHIASHFVLVPGQPGAGWLQLGRNRRITLQALAGPEYRFDGLDLLTLSACETAVPSGPQGDGTALESLAWLAHARGARHVLASLWAIPDASTHPLMQAFYRALATGLPPASALQQAQRTLLAGGDLRPLGIAGGQPRAALRGLGALPPESAQPQPPAPPARMGLHPYHWGAFVLLSQPEADHDLLPITEHPVQAE